jgi:hypothetical protein
MNELRVYKNFFQPVIKLKSKERRGGRVHRKYDDPRTPYPRVMESAEVEQGVALGKKIKPNTVTFLIADSQPLSLT